MDTNYVQFTRNICEYRIRNRGVQVTLTFHLFLDVNKEFIVRQWWLCSVFHQVLEE